MGVDTIWFAAYFVYACLDGIASKKVKHYTYNYQTIRRYS